MGLELDRQGMTGSSVRAGKRSRLAHHFVWGCSDISWTASNRAPAVTVLRPSPFRSFLSLFAVFSLAAAIVLGASTGSQGNTKPQRVIMLHSFGPRFQPWSDYPQIIRAEISRTSQRPVDFHDHSLLTAGLTDEKADTSFVEYLYDLYAETPPDLIIAIGAPAANFVQRHRPRLFPATPMLFTAVEPRRVQYDKLTENDTVAAVAHDFPAAFENILRVLPRTKTIAIVNGTSPNETFWLGEMRRELSPLIGRVELKFYNELSFEDILKDASNLPPDSAIFWHLMNVDAAGVAHEANAALSKLAATANAPIFSYLDSFFGDPNRRWSNARGGGGKRDNQQLLPFASSMVKRPAASRRLQPTYRVAKIRLAADAALGNQREQSSAREHGFLQTTHVMGTLPLADRHNRCSHPGANCVDPRVAVGTPPAPQVGGRRAAADG